MFFCLKANKKRKWKIFIFFNKKKEKQTNNKTTPKNEKQIKGFFQI